MGRHRFVEDAANSLVRNTMIFRDGPQTLSGQARDDTRPVGQRHLAHRLSGGLYADRIYTILQ